jgi:hypothetical protein
MKVFFISIRTSRFLGPAKGNEGRCSSAEPFHPEFSLKIIRVRVYTHVTAVYPRWQPKRLITNFSRFESLDT